MNYSILNSVLVFSGPPDIAVNCSVAKAAIFGHYFTAENIANGVQHGSGPTHSDMAASSTRGSPKHTTGNRLRSMSRIGLIHKNA